jgi:hypothetical protein
MYKYLNLVSRYNMIEPSDYEGALFIYREIKNINITNLDDISYNVYFTNDFINNNFKVLYRIIEQVQDTNLIIEKQSKYIKYEDIIKIIYHIKRRLIRPLIVNTEDDKSTVNNLEQADANEGDIHSIENHNDNNILSKLIQEQCNQ